MSQINRHTKPEPWKPYNLVRVCRCLVQQGFQAAKLTHSCNIFHVFQECVDWGIPNPLSVRVPEVNSLQIHFPARGRKHVIFIQSFKSWVFTNTFPRKGTETSQNIGIRPQCTLQIHFPARGRKLVGTVWSRWGVCFTNTFPRKGTETLGYNFNRTIGFSFTNTFPRKGTETLDDSPKALLLSFTNTFPRKGTETLVYLLHWYP